MNPVSSEWTTNNPNHQPQTAATAALPPHIQSWLAAIFHPHPVAPCESDPLSIDTLTQLHSLAAQREQLTRLLDEDAQSKLVDYQHDNHYQASMLAAVSMLPSSFAANLPALTSSARAAHGRVTPSAGLPSSLSALTSLAQRLALHSVDEPAMLAALLAHKATEQQQHYEQQQLTHAIATLQRHIATTQRDIASHHTLLRQLDHSAATLQHDTQQHTTELHTYTTKHKEYNQRLLVARNKLKHHEPTLSQLLAVRDEAAALEGRLQRLQGEVAVWDGLSSDVRVARRQVAEAELDVMRLEEEIERRLCAMSAFE